MRLEVADSAARPPLETLKRWKTSKGFSICPTSYDSKSASRMLYFLSETIGFPGEKNEVPGPPAGCEGRYRPGDARKFPESIAR